MSNRKIVLVYSGIRADTARMKNEQVAENLGALPFDGNAANAEGSPTPSAPPPRPAPEAGPIDVATASDDFRAMLIQRHSAPYHLPSRYRHWGINE